MWRVFCAVEIPEHVHARMQDHVRQLRETVPDVAPSWTRIENIHLTLKFFGNVALDRIPKISTATSRAAKEFSSFPIGVGTTGVFPGPSRPQVLWIGVSDSTSKLSGLQRRLEEECEIEGFEKEDRAFRPHLTLARMRKAEGAKRLAEAHLHMQFDPAEITLTELIVFRSELSNKGSRYTAISRHELSSQ